MITLSAPSCATPTDGLDPLLCCRTCQRTFDFSTGEVAIVVRRAAFAVGRVAPEDGDEREESYGLYPVEVGAYAFVHDGACAVAASALRWAEPPTVCAAFGRDLERLRIVDARPAHGWAAVMPTTPPDPMKDNRVHFEPLVCWVVVQHQDGSQRTEGITRPAGANDELGTVEFPEAHVGPLQWLGYASPAEQLAAGACSSRALTSP
jgi:hypothetical protein